MALDPFLSEIQMFSFSFAPRGWAQCNGQSLPINQNQALFSLLGTTYGGDGTTSFNLPDLRGRTAIHSGTLSGGGAYPQGQAGGEENHTLLATEIGPHNHLMQASSNSADLPNADNNLLANAGSFPMFSASQDGTTAGAIIANGGGGQGHPNLQPYLAINYCIALTGIFPPRN